MGGKCLMALSLFRLHTGSCNQQYERGNREGRDCRCVIHVEGGLNGEFIRASTRTRAWSRAEAQVKKAERLGRWIPAADGDEERPADTPAIKVAIDSYVATL